MSIYFNSKVVSNLLGSFALLFSTSKRSEKKHLEDEKQIKTLKASYQRGKKRTNLQRSYNSSLSF
jgi:hypothetical protein